MNIKDIENYAKINNIPIMLPDGIAFLTNYIKENNVKRILEIGTAIGYSAIKMALVNKNIKITTIERDEERYNEAIKNIEAFDLSNQIDTILDDAFNVNLNTSFDLIFIDAAKAQYIKFFEKFKINLNSNGVIVSDNLDFHGLTHTNKKLSRNLTQLVRKINNYVYFLKENKEFSSEFYNIGDGIAISKLKNS